MKSLYVGVLLAMLSALSLALLAFLALSHRVETHYLNPVFEAMDELELESARTAFENGGRPALSTYMDRLNRDFGPSHYLLNASGIDIISGESRADLLPARPAVKSRGFVNQRFTMTHQSADHNYWLVAVDVRSRLGITFLPYYLLVVGITALLCCLAAVAIVSPIRGVTAAVERFGMGDLSARVKSTRRDEIGRLARSFDEMADRLETLLTSERRLLQDISHELRSPLTRLKFAIRLGRTAPSPELVIDRVERDVNRMTSLVSEIVEMTRMEGDPQACKFELVKLGEIICETVDDCRIEAQLYHGCTIRVEGRLSEVVGDRELLRRAVENVLRNAIRYSPEHANIDLTLAENSHAAIITVRDYGAGVPEESLTQIFEPFFRVEAARDEQSGGLGLGLSIAARAIRLHRGTITARNASPGLQVQIRIPSTSAGDHASSEIVVQQDH